MNYPDYRQILIDRHRRWRESSEIDGHAPLGLIEYRARQAIARWRQKYQTSGAGPMAVPPADAGLASGGR